MTQDPRAFGLPARHEEEFARPDLGDSAEVLLLLEDLVDASPAMEAALERLGRIIPTIGAQAKLPDGQLALYEELLLAAKALLEHIGPSSAPAVVEAWAVVRRAERAGWLVGREHGR